MKYKSITFTHHVFVWAVLSLAGITSALMLSGARHDPRYYIAALYTLFASAIYFGTGRRKISILPWLMLLLYVLPFTVFVEYLLPGQANYAEYHIMVWRLIQRADVISFISALGLVGLCGLVFGLYLGSKKFARKRGSVPIYSAISKPWYLVFMLVAVVFAGWNAPEETILTMSYAELRAGASSSSSMSGVVYLAYAIVLFLFHDVMKHRSLTATKIFKITVLSVGVIAVVVFFGLLRGSRNSIGMLFGMLAIYLDVPHPGTWRERSRLFWKKARKVFLPGMALMAIFFALTYVRATPYDRQQILYQLSESGQTFYKRGTWNGPLYSCFGLAEEYLGGGVSYLKGRTYVDYFLSLPPGFVADLFDYQRPIDNIRSSADSERLPGWWYMGYTVGGLHPVVVPFKNFGFLGVFLVMAAFGMFIAYAEELSRSGSVVGMILWFAIFICSAHWFWYGDMYLIRGLMACFAVGIGYNFLTRHRFSLSRARRPYGPGFGRRNES